MTLTDIISRLTKAITKLKVDDQAALTKDINMEFKEIKPYIWVAIQELYVDAFFDANKKSGVTQTLGELRDDAEKFYNGRRHDDKRRVETRINQILLKIKNELLNDIKLNWKDIKKSKSKYNSIVRRRLNHRGTYSIPGGSLNKSLRVTLQGEVGLARRSKMVSNYVTKGFNFVKWVTVKIGIWPCKICKGIAADVGKKAKAAGYGRGVYHKSEVPPHPHPLCRCIVKPIKDKEIK